MLVNRENVERLNVTTAFLLLILKNKSFVIFKFYPKKLELNGVVREKLVREEEAAKFLCLESHFC